MSLDFRRFGAEHYDEYAAWFADPDLDCALGPMDHEWLDAVLGQPETEGMTWAVFRGEEMVAVIETVFDPAGKLPPGITGIAVKPTLRRQGIGAAVLAALFARHARRGFSEHLCYISTRNPAGRALAESVGFVATSEPDEHGYIEFRRRA